MHANVCWIKRKQKQVPARLSVFAVIRLGRGRMKNFILSRPDVMFQHRFRLSRSTSKIQPKILICN